MIPQIKLETIGHFMVKLILGATYLTVLGCGIASFYEPETIHQATTVIGGACNPAVWSGNDSFSNCFTAGVPDPHLARTNESTVWQSHVSFDSSISLYSGFSVRFVGVADNPYNFTTFLPVNVTQVQIFGGDGFADKLHDSTVGVRFYFSSDSSTSEPLWLMTRPAGFINLVTGYEAPGVAWVGDYTSFTVRVSFKDIDLGAYVDRLSMLTECRNADYLRGVVIARYVLVGISATFLAYWLYSLCKISWTRILPEQIWITFVLSACILFSDPFYGAMVQNPSQTGYWYASTCGVLLASVGIMVFWMLMVDGLRTHNVLNSKNTRWSRARFYGLRILFGALLLSAESVILSEQARMQQNSDQDNENRIGQAGEIDDLYTGPVLFGAFVVALFCFLYFVVHIVVNICRANGELRKLPYVTTRYRQLSFRIFVYQSALIIVYFLFDIISDTVRQHGVYENTNTTELSSKKKIYRYKGYEGIYISSRVLLVVYCNLLASMYLPSEQLAEYYREKKRREHRRQASIALTGEYIRFSDGQDTDLASHCIRVGSFMTSTDSRALQKFSLRTATWLVYFANQAYFDPEDVPETASASGRANIPRWFGFRIGHVLRGPFDSHAYVAWSHVIDSRASVRVNPSPARSTFSSFDASGAPGSGIFHQNDAYPVVVIALRGTSSLANVKTDLDMFRREVVDVKGLDAGLLSGVPRAHRGFWRTFKCFEEPLVQIVANIVSRCEDNGLPPPRIYCTGHSLGGALAVLVAYALRTRLKADVQLYNYGSPRVVNHAFAREYNDRVPDSFRIVGDDDFIPETPKLCCMYKHVGSHILIDGEGNMIINPAFVEKTLRFRSRSSLAGHTLDTYKACIRKVYEKMYPRSTRPHVVPGMPLYRPLYTPRESIDESEAKRRGPTIRGSMGAVHDDHFDSKIGRSASADATILRAPRPIQPAQLPVDGKTAPDLATGAPEREVPKPRPRPGSVDDTRRVIAEQKNRTDETKRVFEQTSARGPRIPTPMRRSRRGSAMKGEERWSRSSTQSEADDMTTVREVKTSYGYTIVITPQRRPTALDLKIDSQVSLRPILKWNGVEYDVLLDNIPDELERHFKPVHEQFKVELNPYESKDLRSDRVDRLLTVEDGDGADDADGNNAEIGSA